MKKEKELLSENVEEDDDIKIRISQSVIKRMALYLNALEKLQVQKGQESFFVPSTTIARLSGVKAVQVRKDFSHFGTFGRPGVGYEADNLRKQIIKILNLTQNIGIAFVGIGQLGSALVRYYYQRFSEREHGYFEPRALFDVDPEKKGTSFEGLKILPLEKMPEVIKELGIEVSVITVPSDSAQEVAELAVESGVKAILNFAPVILEVPDHIKLQSVDLSTELEHMGYYL